jgi:hypothetical protein
MSDIIKLIAVGAIGYGAWQLYRTSQPTVVQNIEKTNITAITNNPTSITPAVPAVIPDKPTIPAGGVAQLQITVPHDDSKLDMLMNAFNLQFDKYGLHR